MDRFFLDIDGTIARFREVDTLETLFEKGYFRNLEPIKNVICAVKKIMENYSDIEIFTLSAVLEGSKYAEKEKNEWIDEYLPDIDENHRIFCKCGEDKKDAIIGGIGENDYLLEDFSQNLLLWCPPGNGIKLLNGINHHRGTWRGNCLSVEKTSNELVEGIINIIKNKTEIKDEIPSKIERVIEIKPLVEFKTDNHEYIEWKKQVLAIIFDKGFKSMKWTSSLEETFILTAASGENYDWKLTCDNEGKSEKSCINYSSGNIGSGFNDLLNALPHSCKSKRMMVSVFYETVVNESEFKRQHEEKETFEHEEQEKREQENNQNKRFRKSL